MSQRQARGWARRWIVAAGLAMAIACGTGWPAGTVLAQAKPAPAVDQAKNQRAFLGNLVLLRGRLLTARELYQFAGQRETALRHLGPNLNSRMANIEIRSASPLLPFDPIRDWFTGSNREVGEWIGDEFKIIAPHRNPPVELRINRRTGVLVYNSVRVDERLRTTVIAAQGECRRGFGRRNRGTAQQAAADSDAPGDSTVHCRGHTFHG